LQGLSKEELRYIASYLGACLVESAMQTKLASRDQIAWDIIRYEAARSQDCAWPATLAGWNAASGTLSGDSEHMMILLLEYLSSCQCGAAVSLSAGSA
jgi:hypothetical protein